MFKSSFISSASIPIFKSSAIASYGEIIGNNKITEYQLNERIIFFDKYSIACLKDGSTEDVLANAGIDVLNFFGFFTGTEIDYPDHWFLIATTENNIYYLIQKGEGGKSIAYFKDKDMAKNSVKKNYHNNGIDYLARFYLRECINIKDVIKYIEKLSDTYNLIDDNCQVFVRNIIDHFDMVDEDELNQNEINELVNIMNMKSAKIKELKELEIQIKELEIKKKKKDKKLAEEILKSYLDEN